MFLGGGAGGVWVACSVFPVCVCLPGAAAAKETSGLTPMACRTTLAAEGSSSGDPLRILLAAGALQVGSPSAFAGRVSLGCHVPPVVVQGRLGILAMARASVSRSVWV